MKEPNKNDEQLSALLDGRIQGEQRKELLAHLSTNDDDYAVFADTASLLRAMEEEEARTARPDDVIPLPRPQRPRWPRRPVLALAASIAAVALVTTFALQTRGATLDPVRLAERAVPGSQALPAGWRDGVRWTDPRGPGDAEQDVAAVRAGVLLMQLAVAAQARDTGAIRLLATRLSEYDPGAAPGTPIPRIAENPAASPDSVDELIRRAADRLARSLGGRKPLELGAWMEAAILAASSRNREFFRDGTTPGMLRRAERLADDDAAVDSVRVALPANDGPADWPALEESLEALLSHVAS